MEKSGPVSCENGDPPNWGPRSLFSYEIRDPHPHFHNILGTPGSLFSYEIGGPSMTMGTPMQFFPFAAACHLHVKNNVGK